MSHDAHTEGKNENMTTPTTTKTIATTDTTTSVSANTSAGADASANNGGRRRARATPGAAATQNIILLGLRLNTDKLSPRNVDEATQLVRTQSWAGCQPERGSPNGSTIPSLTSCSALL